MPTYSFNFTVILGNNEKEFNLKCCTDVFSVNRPEILKCISDSNAVIVNSNTVQVFSKEAFVELTQKLVSL